MNNPRVTVCMPTYEPKREHVRAAVESLLQQTMTEWSLVIHDDGSHTEDVREHVSPFLEDERITFVESDQNHGIGSNWNACLTYGKAPVVAYLFQDDLWAPQYLEHALQILDEHPNVDFVSLGHDYVSEGNAHPIYQEVQQFIETNIQAGEHPGRELLLWWMEQGLRPNIIGEPSFVVLRRKLIEQVGPFREDMVQFLDSEYWIRCLEHGNWYYSPQKAGSFRVHTAAASAQNELSGQGLYDRLDCFAALIKRLPAEERAQGKHALRQSFADMVQKFFNRLGQKSSVSTQGSGALKIFCLQHPWLVSTVLLQEGWRYLRKH